LIAYQNVFYTQFKDVNGKDALINYSGNVEDFQLNGNKREEGALLNGKRNGIWKLYETNGHLKSIGAYKNGLKDGLWISGDLSGIGFLDNECFDGVIDIDKIKGNFDEKKLSFEESYYTNGLLLKSTVHEVDLN